MSEAKYYQIVGCSVLVATWGLPLFRIEHWVIMGRHNLAGHFIVLKLWPIKVAVGWNNRDGEKYARKAVWHE